MEEMALSMASQTTAIDYKKEEIHPGANFGIQSTQAISKIP